MFSLDMDFLNEYIDELKTGIILGREAMRQDLSKIVMEAADEAIREMQRNHPYTDRTFMLSGGMQANLTKQTVNTATATVTFMAKYARFVNDGTVKNRAYPFLPQGMEAAQRVLDEHGAGAIGVFLDYAAKG